MARNPNPKQPKARKRGAKEPTEWWNQSVEAPRADLPDADRLSRRARRYRRWVLASVVIAPISLFTNFAFYANMGSEAAAPVVSSDRYSQTRSVALIEVRKWLASDPSPLPGGVLVGWERATTQRFDPESTSAGEPYTVETHYMTLATPNGTTFTTTVPIAVDDVHGPVPLALPSLVPVPPSDLSWDASTYPNTATASLSEEALVAVQTWAENYTSGDPARFRSGIQDPNPNHSYVPLNGARLVDITVTDSWVSPESSSQAPDSADLVFAEVTLRMEWAFDPLDSNQSAPEIVFTVLLDDANTGAARVVAWGGPGTGLDLAPYENALTGREVLAADEDSLVNTGGEPAITDPDAFTADPEATGGGGQGSGSPRDQSEGQQ